MNTQWLWNDQFLLILYINSVLFTLVIVNHVHHLSILLNWYIQSILLLYSAADGGLRWWWWIAHGFMTTWRWLEDDKLAHTKSATLTDLAATESTVMLIQVNNGNCCVVVGILCSWKGIIETMEFRLSMAMIWWYIKLAWFKLIPWIILIQLFVMLLLMYMF